MEPVTEVAVACPYCGEVVSVLVDPGAEDARYVEDCAVCCAPMELAVSWPEGAEPVVVARRDDD